MGLKNYSWPIYKGPVKRAGFAKRLYEDPFSIKRHAKTTKPKHAGNDYAYQLYLRHHPYKPKHAKPDYRYTKDGRIRKVLPKKEKEASINREIRTVKHKGPKEMPPPRAMLLHVYNDCYEDHFSLEEYRSSRTNLTWWKRCCTCNYFRELLMIDIVIIFLSILLVRNDSSGIGGRLANIVFLLSIGVCPVLIIVALYHHIYKVRK